MVVFTNLSVNERKARLKAEELSADLEAANQQLSEYAIQAEELATIEERNRLAREIHDNLGHYLTVVNVQIGAAKVLMDKDTDQSQRCPGQSPKPNPRRLESNPAIGGGFA